MKIKDIALSAAYVGQRVVKAICVGAQEVWSAFKYIVFADPVVEQICVANFSSDGIGLIPEDAAKVTDIGTIFKGNTEITSFDELDMFGVTELKEGAFQDCTMLGSIQLNKIKKWNRTIFKNCSSLNIDVSMPELEDNGIDNSGMFYNTGIVSISNLGKITYIPSSYQDGQWTFGNCKSLIRVVIPPTCTNRALHNNRYAMHAFHGCTSLKEVVGIENLEYITEHTFAGCTSLNLGHFRSEKLEQIDGYAFVGVKITSLELPNLKTLSYWGIRDIPELTGDISLPNLESLGYYNFTNTNITSISNLGKITRFGIGGPSHPSLVSVVLPETVTQLDDKAIRSAPKLESLNLPQSITTLVSLLFPDCYKLFFDNIDLPNLETLGYRCFNECGGARRISNLGKITKISYGCFQSNKQLTYASIPATCTTIEYDAFRYCSALETVIVNNDVPPTLGDNVFEGTPSTMSIYVPDQSVQAYRDASGWLSYEDQIKPLSQYVES